MISLVEKYQPQTLDAFAGMDRPRAMLNHLAANPYPSAWLLLGPSGLGKTTMALALAKQIGGELHHIPSSKCDKASVDEVCHRCWYIPMNGGYHVILVDEADQMSIAAQLAFLSKLDATAQPPNTIFIFTANDTALLKDRFLSRCRTVKFTHDGLLEPAADLLARIWKAESSAPVPDFRQIVKDSGFNIRQAIMTLEMELIVPSPVVSRTPKPSPRVNDQSVSTDTVDAIALARLLNIGQATIYTRVKKGTLPQPIAGSRPMSWPRETVQSLVAA